MVLSIVCPQVVWAEDAGVSQSKVIVDIEKFTLGQGYILEPVEVPYEEGMTAQDAIRKAIQIPNETIAALSAKSMAVYAATGKANTTTAAAITASSEVTVTTHAAIMAKANTLTSTANTANHSITIDGLEEGYIKGISDPNTPVVLPQLLMEAFEEYEEEYGDYFAFLNRRKEPVDQLKEGDYTVMSGWMYTVDETAPSNCIDAQEVEPNQVIRVRYTINYGADLGNTSIDENMHMMPSLYMEADKLDLMRLMAQINSNESLKQDNELNSLYNQAVDVTSQLEASQDKIDALSHSIQSKIDEILSQSDEPQPLDENQLLEAKESVINYLEQNADFTKDYSKGNGIDWKVFTLARNGNTIPKAYAQQIKAFVSKYDTDKALQEALVSTTEFERMTIGLTAAGYDASSIAGHNLVAHIYNSEGLKEQGINTHIYGLLALDTKPYDLPSDAKNTREDLIQWILESQLEDGSFCYAPQWGSDIDLTAMAIQALAPYYSQSDVKKAIDQALKWLSDIQLSNGGYESWGSESSESLSQVICALISLGKDPEKEVAFIKSEGTLMTHLLSFYDEVAGGFRHTVDGDVDFNYATPQAAYALVAYARLKDGKTYLYDMSDIDTLEVIEKDTPIMQKVNTLKTGAINYIRANTTFDAAYKKGDGRDWNALVLARAGEKVPDGYGKRIGEFVVPFDELEIEKKLVNPTEFERMTIGLTAAGYDATDIAGHSLVEHIYNNEKLKSQGINAQIYGLIALDTKPYEVPEDALYTREELVSLLVGQQLADGSFTYFAGGSGDVDLTAMAIQALAPYDEKQEVKAAIDKALQWLSEEQLANGGYKSWGADCSESVAQVICALVSLGKDPATEADFIKEEGNLLTRLSAFYDETTGGFKHTEKAKVSMASTQQAAYALVSYTRFLAGQTSLYDMSDIEEYFGVAISKYYEVEESTQPVTISLEKEQAREEITINQKSTKTEATLDVSACKEALPSIHIQNEVVEVDLPKGTSLLEGTASLQLPTIVEDTKELTDVTLELQKLIDSKKNVSKIVQYINLGSPSQTIQFNQKIKLIFKNAAGNQAAYKDYAGKVYAITKLKADASKSGYNEVCYDRGEDLIIETNHLTGYIVYAVKDVSVSDGGDISKNETVKISVERKTIGLSDLYNGKVKYEQGDTVYDALVKTGLNLEGDSSYVAGIAGLREKQHGAGSGWMVTVNGEFINCSVGDYKVSPNDTIRWQYTTNLGKDLGSNFITNGDFGGNSYVATSAKTAMNTIVAALKNESALSKWQAFALARAGEKVSDTYKNSLIAEVKENQGVFRKITDTEKMIIVLGSLGVDCSSVAGYNLVEKLYNAEDITKQGNNGLIFALLAVDSKQYEVPSTAKWSRDKIKAQLLKVQNKDGGFPLMTGEASDVDITAMALQALAPYKNEEDVKKAIDQAISYLRAVQKDNGHFTAYGEENSESLSQVIIALTSLGIDPATDTRFIKEDKNLLECLMEYQVSSTSFAHNKSGGANNMATEQALMAIVSYERFKAGKSALYNLDEVTINKVVADVSENIVEIQETSMVDLSQYKDADKISAWAKEELQEAISLGIINGYGDTLKPQKEVTRAEFTSMLIRMLQAEKVASVQNPFKDIEMTDWYAYDILEAYNNELIKGISSNKFEPKAQMTREQVAVILARVLKEGNKTNISFKDEKQISAWAMEAVNKVATQGVFEGYEDGTFRPKQTVTREVAAIILLRIQKKLEDVASMQHPL